MSETSALVFILKVTGCVVGGTIATGLCIYGAYKLYEKFFLEKPHKNKALQSGHIITVDDLLPGNVPAKQNAVNSEKQRVVDANRVKELEDRITFLENQLKNENKQVPNDMENKVQKWVNESLENDANSVNSVSVDSAYSVASFSSGDSNSHENNIDPKRWSQMTAAEKNKQLCPACSSDKIETVTVECDHPLFCRECADALLLYPNTSFTCPSCDNKYFNYITI